MTTLEQEFIIGKSNHMMQCIAYLLGFRIHRVRTQQLSNRDKNALRELVQFKCPNDTAAVVNEKIERYDEVMLVWSFGRLKGAMFIVTFCAEEANHLYLGPTFFRSRPGLGLVFLVLIDILTKGVRQLYVFSEIQNPEILMHMQITVRREDFWPQRRSYLISEEARHVIQRCIAHVPQLDSIDVETFCSQSPDSRSYFPRKPDQRPVVGWLLHHGVNLQQGDSLVVLCKITRSELKNIGKRIFAYWRTYPQPRKDYLHELREYAEQIEIPSEKTS